MAPVRATRSVTVVALLRVLVPSLAIGTNPVTAQPTAPCPPQLLNSFNVPEVPDIRSSAVWDPDDAGPRQPLLVLSGYFDLTYPFRARGIIGWDGTRLVPIESLASQSFRSLLSHRADLYGVSDVLYRYDADGTTWIAASPSGFSVKSAVVWRDELYIAGSGPIVATVLVLRGGAWVALPRLSGDAPDSLTVVDDRLVAAGSFRLPGGPAPGIDRVAVLESTGWSRLGSSTSDLSTPALIVSSDGATLLSLESNLYVLDRGTWVRHPEPARAFFAADGRAFARPTDIDDGRLLAFDGGSWSRLGDLRRGGPGFGGVSFNIHSLAWFQGRLHALGSSSGDSGTSPETCMLEYVGDEWRPFGEGPGGTISLMLPADGLVYTADGVRGPWNFSNMQRPLRPFVRAWDGSRFRAVGAAFQAPATSAPLQHLARITSLSHDPVFGVIATGFFAGNSGQSMTGIAFLSDESWLPLGSSLWPYREADGVLRDPVVHRVLRYRGELLAVGRFSLGDDYKNENIARLNDGIWSAVSFAPPFQAVAFTDAIEFQNKLFVTGEGLTSPLSNLNTTANFDGSSWSVPSDEIDASGGFCVHDGALFAARDRYPQASRVARWSGLGWSQLPATNGPYTLALVSHAGSLFAAGIGPLQRWNGSSWQTMPFAGEVSSLASDRGELLLGGRFNDPQPRDHFLRLTLDRVPSFAVGPRSRSGSCGSTVSLTASIASGYATPAYRWRKDGTPLSDGPTPDGSIVSGSQTSSITITGATPTSSGSYVCEAVVPCGVGVSPAATLRVTCCPTDLDADSMTTDADFQIFAAAYNLLICSAPSMPVACPADFTSDGVVDDRDFLVFVQAFDHAACPAS